MRLVLYAIEEFEADPKTAPSSSDVSPMTPKNPQKQKEPTMPPAAQAWKTFGNEHGRNILKAATNEIEYKNTTAQFHARLSLIVRGLSYDELSNIFSSAIPAFLREGDGASRLRANKAFEDSHTRIEGMMIQRLHAYASEWFASEGGKNYRERYCTAK